MWPLWPMLMRLHSYAGDHHMLASNCVHVTITAELKNKAAVTLRHAVSGNCCPRRLTLILGAKLTWHRYLAHQRSTFDAQIPGLF